MDLIDKELVEFIFEYITKFREYEDKEEVAIAGLTTDEQDKIQIRFEEFVFNTLKICAKERKYFCDYNDDFENYTMYLKYRNQLIEVFVMYGQGNYFYVKKSDNEYKEDLSIDLESII